MSLCIVIELMGGTVIGIIYFLILYAIVTVLSPAMPVDTPALNQTMHQIGSQSIVTYLLRQDTPSGTFFFCCLILQAAGKPESPE